MKILPPKLCEKEENIKINYEGVVANFKPIVIASQNYGSSFTRIVVFYKDKIGAGAEQWHINHSMQ